MRHSVQILALLSLALLGCADTACALRRKQPPVAALSTRGLTRLRTSSPALLISRSLRGTEVRHLNVDVNNVGEYQAKDVVVMAEWQDGIRLPLRGPKTLGVNQGGTYFLTSRQQLIEGSGVRIVARCSTCRR